MHDLHAVEQLIERLEGAGLEGVSEVRVEAGVGFSPEALEQAYAMLTQGTPFEGSRLVVTERLEDRVCPACGRSWTVSRDDVAGHAVLCPSCGTPSPIEGGAGLQVTGISP